MHGKLAVLLGIAAMAAAGASVSGLGSIVNPPLPPAGLDAHESNASVSLMGQCRTNVSAWLWVRTDLYLHNGIEMRPITEAEQRLGRTAESHAGDGHDELWDESSIVTVVPPKERDFRGVLGDVERAVAAYKDMHSHDHNDPALAMPLFRLMTWIDPKFVPGWTTGAMVLSRDSAKSAQLHALRYLQDGLEENPGNVEILAELGRHSASRLRDLPKAVGYLAKAAQEGVPRFETLSEPERDSLLQTFRWLGICLRDMGETARREEVLAEGLRLFPDDPILLQMAFPPPSVLTDEGLRLWMEEHTKQLRSHRG